MRPLKLNIMNIRGCSGLECLFLSYLGLLCLNMALSKAVPYVYEAGSHRALLKGTDHAMCYCNGPLKGFVNQAYFKGVPC